MNTKEAIEIIKIAIAEVEWNYPMEYAVAFEEAIKALEKQIPEKPNAYYGFYHCPACEHSLVEYEGSGGIHYCHWCGQSIDWGDAEC